jgi:MSHA pilin protein MshC
MIEIIAVLVIIGIISVVVMSRGSATDEAKLQAEVDTLKGHLRYAQYTAMNDIPPTKWGIQISGQSYTLVRNLTGNGATFDSPHNLPGESSATHSFAAPLTATAINVLFDEWGSPYNAATKLLTDATVTISSESITITAGTGFIP